MSAYISCTCLHICPYACPYACPYTCGYGSRPYMSIHISMHISIRTSYTYVYMHACTHFYTSVCICTYTCLHACPYRSSAETGVHQNAQDIARVDLSHSALYSSPIDQRDAARLSVADVAKQAARLPTGQLDRIFSEAPMRQVQNLHF